MYGLKPSCAVQSGRAANGPLGRLVRIWARRPTMSAGRSYRCGCRFESGRAPRPSEGPANSSAGGGGRCVCRRQARGCPPVPAPGLSRRAGRAWSQDRSPHRPQTPSAPSVRRPRDHERAAPPDLGGSPRRGRPASTRPSFRCRSCRCPVLDRVARSSQAAQRPGSAASSVQHRSRCVRPARRRPNQVERRAMPPLRLSNASYPP